MHQQNFDTKHAYGATKQLQMNYHRLLQNCHENDFNLGLKHDNALSIPWTCRVYVCAETNTIIHPYNRHN